MLFLFIVESIIIIFLLIYIISLKNKNLDQENALKKLNCILENKMLMRESSLHESIQIKKSLLKKIGKAIKGPSMNMVNKITLLLDRIQEQDLNLLNIKDVLLGSVNKVIAL